MALNLDAANRAALVRLLQPVFATQDQRRALVELALGWDSPALATIDWSGEAQVFTVRLVGVLADFGEVAPGQQALVAVLATLRERLGADRQAEIDDLLDALAGARQREAARAQAASVGAGFEALSRLVGSPEIAALLRRYQSDFEGARSKVGTIGHYKALHDGFQALEDLYAVLNGRRQRLAEHADDWDMLALESGDLGDAVAALLAEGADARFAAQDAPVMSLLRRGSDTVAAAAAARRLDQLESGLMSLQRAINLGLAGFNDKLLAAAGELPLTRLNEAMAGLRGSLVSLPGVDPAVPARVDAAAAAMDALARQLVVLVQAHGQSQDLDDELRRVATTFVLQHDIGEVRNAWEDIKALAAPLHAGEGEAAAPGLARIREEQARVDGALDGQDEARIEEMFRRYRSRFAAYFRALDKQLLDLCAQIESIDEPLGLLLGRLT